MICPNLKCRKENPDDNIFCEYCGTRLDATPKPEIITTRIWKCSVCGTENTTDMRSCIKCGNERVGKTDKNTQNKLTEAQKKELRRAYDRNCNQTEKSSTSTSSATSNTDNSDDWFIGCLIPAIIVVGAISIGIWVLMMLQ